MSERQIVIVAYQPKAGKVAELLQLTREHLPLLRAEGLATSRPAIVCQASNGAIVEVFEWEAGGAERAHATPSVQALWARYMEACEFTALNKLEESSQMFASFKPLQI